MPRVNLTGGFYVAQDVAASAQECMNLYPEPINASDEPTQFITYPTPGLKQIYQATQPGAARALHTDSKGNLIVVINSTVTQILPDNTNVFIGNINEGTTPVQIIDNGLTMVIVDGTPGGFWYATMPSQTGGAFGTLVQWIDTTGQDHSSSPAGDQTLDSFYGSSTVAVLDQFFIFVQPNSRHFYTSPSDFTNQTDTPFDSTYIASKTTYPDLLVGVTTVGQFIWLFGMQTTEIWYDSGADDFPFQRMSGVLINQGCQSPYSIASNSSTVFWLGRDMAGNCTVYYGSGETSEIISTYAISNELSKCSPENISIAIGSIYQQDGHTFYMLSIPNDGKTFFFDFSTKLWHMRSSLDASGNESRYRASFVTGAYGNVYAADYQSGQVYKMSPEYHTDDGTPIVRRRAFPHAISDRLRVIHRKATLDFGGGAGTVNVTLDYSNNRGYDFVNPISLSFQPEQNQWPTIWRLGMARDRVYRVYWTDTDQNYITGFMGGYIEADPSKF